MSDHPSYEDLQGTIQRLKDELEHVIKYNTEQTQDKIQLQRIIDGIPYCIFWKDTNSIHLGCNKMFADFAGIKEPEDILGMSDFDLSWKEGDAERYRETDKRIIATNTPEYHVTEIEHQSEEEYRWFDVSKVPMHDSEGNVVGILGVFEDITDRKETEIKLVESEFRFRTIVANIPGAVYRCKYDEYWTMLYISDSIEEITKYPASDFMENKIRSFQSIIYENDSHLTNDNIIDGIKKHEPFIVEYRVVDKNGNIRWVYEKGQGVYDDFGELKWLDGAIFDITEQKRLEQVKLDVERILRHDLKSPLNSIINAPQLIKEYGSLTPEQEQLVDIIEEAGHKMLNMLNMSMDLYKMETGKYEFHPVSLNIIEIVREILLDLDAEISAYETSVKVLLNDSELKDDDQLIFACERLLCYSMLANLIKNAVEASNSKEVTVYLEDKDEVRIFIHNFGEVPDEIKMGFFEKYSTYGKGNEGTGLGTYSARLICRTQGGEISMRSNKEEGTFVELKFPK